MLKAFPILAILAVFNSQVAVAGSTACDRIFSGGDRTSIIVKKLNFQLERLFVAAESANEDFSTIQITGIMKTNSEIENAEQAAALFEDESVLIRAVMKSGSSNIITFQASLAGVLNAASKDSVLVMNMSQRVASTVGITSRK